MQCHSFAEAAPNVRTLDDIERVSMLGSDILTESELACGARPIAVIPPHGRSRPDSHLPVIGRNGMS
jgi:hypothetical protein